MNLSTKYFGTIEYTPEDILTFGEGLFGFEDEKQFLLLPFEGDAHLLCFQSVVTPNLAFVAMNPFSLKPDYTPILGDKELGEMKVTQSQELCFYVLCVVREPVPDSTVNLRCPIAVNPDERIAMQAILDCEDYNMRHPLGEFSYTEDASC